MAKQSKDGVLRSMPQSLSAEAAVLGSMIIDSRCIGDVMELVGEDDFYHDEHRIIYRTLRAMVETQEPQAIDGLTVRERLEQTKQLKEIGGLEYLRRVMETVPSAANVVYYAKIVQEAAKRRTLIVTAQELAEAGYDESQEIGEALCEAEAKLFAATESREGDCQPADRLIISVLEEIERREGNSVTGLTTGYYELDDMLSGLQDGELIILASRPSIGKTALAMNIAFQVAVVGNIPVHVFSLEMSKGSLLERVVCCEAEVNSQQVRTGNVTGEDYRKLVDVGARLTNGASLFIDDSSYLTPFDLRSRARRIHSKEDTGLIIVDYLQLMGAGQKTENRQQEVTLISRHLKALARELNVPVLVLSQLNRGPESREDHRPRLSDLRESGAVEQDADVVMLLYRKDYYGKNEPDYVPTNVAEVIVAKQRNGPTGTVSLIFRERITRFENLAVIEEPV
ncbi:MAG TPA: replicative DNA helicase [Sedimentisphaerales bacterium]|nr:replicative DNA helicase [Sedimentisphaerales bacterium]